MSLEGLWCDIQGKIKEGFHQDFISLRGKVPLSKWTSKTPRLNEELCKTLRIKNKISGVVFLYALGATSKSGRQQQRYNFPSENAIYNPRATDGGGAQVAADELDR